jgi:hypothetical protein
VRLALCGSHLLIGFSYPHERSLAFANGGKFCRRARYDLEVLKRCPPESYRAVLRDYRRENVEKATQLAHQFGLTVEITPGFGDFEVWQDSVGIFGVVRAKRENVFSC